jgi:hypothetical protein
VSGRCRSAGALLETLLADNRDVVDEPEVLDEDMTPLGYWRTSTRRSAWRSGERQSSPPTPIAP